MGDRRHVCNTARLVAQSPQWIWRGSLGAAHARCRPFHPPAHSRHPLFRKGSRSLGGEGSIELIILHHERKLVTWPSQEIKWPKKGGGNTEQYLAKWRNQLHNCVADHEVNLPRGYYQHIASLRKDGTVLWTTSHRQVSEVHIAKASQEISQCWMDVAYLRGSISQLKMLA